MHSLPTSDDVTRTLGMLRRPPPYTVVLAQIDPGPLLDPGVASEIEALIEHSFGASCWRLEDGRYLGVYIGTDEVRPKAEALRQSIGDRYRRTVSLGLALPRTDLGALDLLLRAEQALLAARKAGGNRLELAPRQDTSKTERNRLGHGQP